MPFFRLALLAALALLLFWGIFSLLRSTVPADVSGVAPARASGAGSPHAQEPDLVPAPRSSQRTSDAPVEPAPTDVASTRTPLTIVGRCVDGTARPLVGVEVSVPLLRIGTQDAGGFRILHRPDEAFARATTGADGRFAAAVDPGSAARILAAQLTSHLPGFASCETWIEVPPDASRHDAGDLVLRPGATILGRVVEPDGMLVVDATVHVSVPGEQPGSWRRRSESVRSDPAGAFALRDVPAGSVILRAETQDQRASAGASLELAAGEVREGVDLVVPPYLDPRAISGIVLGLDGAPVAKALVHSSYRSSFGGSGSTMLYSNSDGRFRVQGAAGSVFELRTTDPRDESCTAALTGVEAGRHDIVLRLERSRALTLRVEDDNGRPLERFGWRIWHLQGSHRRGGDQKPEIERAGGEARVPVDPGTFEVEVRALGFESALVGPFAPGSAPDVAVARLHRLPALRGRVTADGKPVANARLRTFAELLPQESVGTEGFDQRVDVARTGERGTTDADGRFDIAQRGGGAWWLRADADGYAPALGGPVDLTPGRADADVEIRLTPGGAIEGIVRWASGAPIAGAFVAVSSGDGAVRTAESDAAGRWRVERLAPGGVQVRRVPARLPEDPRSTHSRTHDDLAPAIVWDAVIPEGGVVIHDVVVAEPVDLIVRWDSAASALGAWNVVLRGSGEERPPVLTIPAGAADDGAGLRVRLPSPGSWSLRATLESEDLVAALYADVEVPKSGAAWTLALPQGRIHGRVRFGTHDASVQLSANLGGDARLTLTRRSAADGTFSFPVAPSGTCTITVKAAGGDRQHSVESRAGATIDAGDV